MKRFLTFLALCCLMAAGAWAERYHIYQNNGTLHTTGSSTFCSQWTSTQTDPQISINVTDGNGAANDMQSNSTYADGGIVCYTGNNRDKQGYKATLTVAASHGYNITGYEFDASSLTDGCTISVSDGTTTKTLTGTTAQTISKTGVNAQNFVITIQCTAGSDRNTAVLFNNFYVTYEAAEPIENEYKVVFETPSSGTPYRIPAVAQAQNGDLIFVSDYRYSKADIGMATNGKLDLKMRKKKANGTWENEKVLQACIESPTFTAFGDPCIVVDNTPGNPGKVMVTSCCGNVSYPHGSHSNHQGWARWYSTDNGDTWSSYTDISQQVVNQVDQRTGAKLAAFFIGSGKISQSKTIKVNNYNRLYCASLTTVSPDGADANKTTMNYVWYSDDFGENWHMLGTPDGNPINGGNEPKAEELPDGSVLISSRTAGGRIYNIWHYTDTEAGKGYWGTQQKCTATYGADCNGEILVVPVTRASNSGKTYLLLQSIPADANRNYVSIYWKELTDLTKYRTAAELSNGGWTKFPVSTTTSAYSTMCQMKDGHIAFFYEEYDHNSGYDMVYKNFSVEEITNNAYSYSTLDATEKANYLTNGVGAYFDGESSAVQALAATYKAAPDADKYDALNAALQSPDELYFTPGWYRIKVGSGSAQKQAEYKGRYLYGKPLPDTWPIGVTDNANDLRTYVYITGTHDKWHIEFNHDTDAAYFATHDCKNSATPGNLSFIPNSEGTEWKIWGNNSYRWMGWYLNSTPSIGSTSTDNETNNGCYFVFEKVDAPVLVAGKVYKIKAKFATGTSDIYLSAGSTGMTLPTAEATTPQSYWIARTTNDATYPWKFQSGYGNGKYLSVANGVSETASTFDVRTCADVSGTYHLWNSQSGGRYIGTYSSTNSKHGFGDFDGKGCWADGHHAGSDYTTDYIFEEVQNVTAYTVCGEGSLNVTGITGYTYASEISAGGVVIVPSNITPTASNFTTPDGLIAIVNTDAKTITLSKTYKKGVAVTQQSDLQNGDLVIVDVKAKNATTDAVLYYVGESTSMSNRNNFRAHIYNVTEYPANHVWEVVDVNTSTTPNTFKLRSVADNTVYLPSGNTTSATNTAATFYFKESTGYNDGVNRFALAFSNNENADHYTYHFNAQPATGQGEPICFWGYGAASTDSQGAFAFYKVAEDIPTAEISLANTTVTSSQLSELSITFTGDNAAQVQLSATQHTAYLTPKASTPAQVKAQNGKFKAAPAGAIEGNITAVEGETGKFSIAFPEESIATGDYEVTIPEGTFYVGTTAHPVAELKANYKVAEEPAPTLPPYADLPLTSGVYEIQNTPTRDNRGYLVDYTSYKNGPSLAECKLSSHENKHPDARDNGTTTSSKWYVYNDNNTYYIVSLSTLEGNTTPKFLKVGASKNTKATYSETKEPITIVNSNNTANDFTIESKTYHSQLISGSASSTVYLSAACGTQSTSGAVSADTNANDGGSPWVFIPCDASTLTTEQVALRDKAIEIIEYDPYDGKTFIIRHANPAQATKHLAIADDGEKVVFSTRNDGLEAWTFEATGTPGQYKLKNPNIGYIKNTANSVQCTLDFTTDGSEAAIIAIADYTPAASQATAGLTGVVTLTNTATSKQLFNNAESNTTAYFGYGSSTASNSWGCQFIIEEYVAPSELLPTFEAQAPNAITSGWYQIKWDDTDSDNKTGVVSSPNGKFVKNYDTDITVSDKAYPLYLDTENGVPATADESAKTYVYVDRASANVGTVASIRSANGHYVSIDGSASIAEAKNLYLIFRSSQSKPKGTVVSSGTAGGNRNSWLPIEENGNKYIGQGSQNKYPVAEFSPVDLATIGLTEYTVNVEGTTSPVQVSYSGSDNKGLDKVYDNGTFFFTTGATPTTEQFSAPQVSGSYATITVDGTNHTITVTYSIVDDITEQITYDQLDGNTWTKWAESAWAGSVPTDITALDNTNYTEANLRVISKKYEFEAGENLQATFQYVAEGHNKRTDIVGVDIVDADGNVVLSDYHNGYTGGNNSLNVYTLNNIPAGIYTVRYITSARSSDGANINTGGTITNVITVGQMPVGGHVYTIYNDHSDVAYYLQNNTDGCTQISTDAAEGDANKWIVWGDNTTGIQIYNLANKHLFTTKDGTLLDIKNVNAQVGVTIYNHGTNTTQAGNKASGALRVNDHYTNGYKANEDRTYSTDFVFIPTGQFAYHVESYGELTGLTVNIKGESHNIGDFYITDTELTEADLESVGENTKVVLDGYAIRLDKKCTYKVNITENEKGATAVLYNGESKSDEDTFVAFISEVNAENFETAYDYISQTTAITPNTTDDAVDYDVTTTYTVLYHPTWRANPDTRPLKTGTCSGDGTWTGKAYMIYDASIQGNTNRSGFEYGGDSRVCVTYQDPNKVWALDNTTGTHLINNDHPVPFTFKAGIQYLWVIENAEGTADGEVNNTTAYYLRNVANGKYYDCKGYPRDNKDDATKLYIQDFQTGTISGANSTTHSYSQYEERVDAISDDKGIFLIGGQMEGHTGASGNGNCWNGDENKFNNWETSSPFCFYQVVELTDAMDQETWDVCLDYAHYIDGVGDLSHDFGTFGEKTADSEDLVVGTSTFSQYVDVVIENTKKYVRAPKAGRLLTIKNALSLKYMNGADVTNDYSVMWYNSQNQIVSYNTGLGFNGVAAAELPEMDAAEFETHTADQPSFRLGTMVIKTEADKFFSVANEKASALCTNDANTTDNSTWFVDNAPYVNVSFGSANNGFTTFLAPEPMIVPDGVTAYTVTKNEVEEDAEKGQKKECILTLTTIKASEDGNAYIPANTAVILEGTAGETVQVEARLVPQNVTDEEYDELDKDWDGFIDTPALTTENVLKALDYSCVNPQYNGGTYEVEGQTKYIYSLANGAFSYYKGTKIQAFKCFLALDQDYRAGSGNTAPFRVIFEDGTEAIHVLEALSNDDSNCFDLSGRRVQSNARGLLINNGKKMLRK